jgi:hypothetical protein
MVRARRYPGRDLDIVRALSAHGSYPGDLHDALGLLAARRASEYPSLVSEVTEIVIRLGALC